MKPKNISMQTIADKLGISKMTVSRVLGRSGYCKDETARRVIETARELGYFRKDPRYCPPTASNLKHSELPAAGHLGKVAGVDVNFQAGSSISKSIALICDSRMLSENVPLLSELCSRFASSEMAAYVIPLDCSSDLSKMAQILISNGTKTFVGISPCSSVCEFLGFVADMGAAVFLFDPLESFNKRRARFCTMGFDREAETKTLFWHLASENYKKIAIIYREFPPQKRIEKIAALSSLDIVAKLKLDTEPPKAAESLNSLFSSFKSPDAVVCLDVASLCPLLDFMAETGRSAPDDFALACLDYMQNSDMFNGRRLKNSASRKEAFEVSSLLCNWRVVANSIFKIVTNGNAEDSCLKKSLGERKLIIKKSSAKPKKSLLWIL